MAGGYISYQWTVLKAALVELRAFSKDQFFIPLVGALCGALGTYLVLGKTQGFGHVDLAEAIWKPLVGAVIGLVVTLMLAFLLFLLRAPSKLYWTLKQQNESQAAQLQTGMKIFYDEHAHGVSWSEEDPKLKYMTSVGVSNGTSRELKNCQVRLHVEGDNQRATIARFWLCEPFSIRPGDFMHKNVFAYDFDVADAPLVVHQEALSDSERISRCFISVKYENGRWAFS
jgi:hypothetical protein